MTHILRIDASPRDAESKSRDLADTVIAQLRRGGEGGSEVSVTERDVSDGLPMVSHTWTRAAYTPEDARTPAEREALALSDEVVAEIKAADIVVISTPIYNFGVPAALKSWIDQVARAGETFRYSESGPEGLLTGKRAIVTVASGGTQVGSAHDFATPHLRHVLGFLGIDDVEVFAADGLMGADADAKVASAKSNIRDEVSLAA